MLSGAAGARPLSDELWQSKASDPVVTPDEDAEDTTPTPYSSCLESPRSAGASWPLKSPGNSHGGLGRSVIPRSRVTALRWDRRKAWLVLVLCLVIME